MNFGSVLLPATGKKIVLNAVDFPLKTEVEPQNWKLPCASLRLFFCFHRAQDDIYNPTDFHLKIDCSVRLFYGSYQGSAPESFLPGASGGRKNGVGSAEAAPTLY